jgi:hypothetical protein
MVVALRQIKLDNPNLNERYLHIFKKLPINRLYKNTTLVVVLFVHADEPHTAGYSDTTWLPRVAVWRLAWRLPSTYLGRYTDKSIDFVTSSLLQREFRQI